MRTVAYAVLAAVWIAWVAVVMFGSNDPDVLMVLGMVGIVGGAVMTKTAPQPVDPTLARSARRDFLERRMWLEAEMGIEHDPAEVAELDRLEEEDTAAAVAPLPPPSRRPDPVGPEAEDIDSVYGFKVDHLTNTVLVPAAAVERVRKFLGDRRIAIDAVSGHHPPSRLSPFGALRGTECTYCGKPPHIYEGTHTYRPPAEVVRLQAHAQRWNPGPTMEPLHGDLMDRCTCTLQVGRGIPDCPVHRLS